MEMEDSKEKHKTRSKSKDSKVSKQTHIIEETSVTGDKQYNCTACRKTFRSRSQKYYHLNCNQLQDMIYKCEHCDKSFARHSQCKYHMESHISPINECSLCQKTFSNPLALKKHEALHKVEPKLCPHCDKTFQKKISLDQHIAAQHLNQLQFGCAYCSKKYASKSTLHLHLQSHEKKRFGCSICGKLFQRNSILNLHLKRHYHTNNYKCPVCQKVFSESGALSRHRKIHEENALQYHCKLCNKSILRKDNMTRHLTTIHPEEKFEEIVEILRSSPTKSVNEQTEITGIESDAEFVNEKDTDTGCSEKHIKNIHTTISNEKCVIIENKIIQNAIQIHNSTLTDALQIPVGHFPNSDFRNNTNDNIDFTDHPIVNHIQVITPVPIYDKELILTDVGTSQEILYDQTLEQSEKLDYITLKSCIMDKNIQRTSNQCIEEILQLPKTEKCYQNPKNIDDSITLFQNPTVISQSYPEKSRKQTEQLTKEYDNYKTPEIQHYFILNDQTQTKTPEKSSNSFKFIESNTYSDIAQLVYPVPKEQDSFTILQSPKPPEQSTMHGSIPVTQTISSVIKSIGNVKQNLTAHIVTASKPISNIPVNLEYKHKKYCRNNYDIDLYRKILGCDDDDEDYNNYSENDESPQDQGEDNQQQNSLKSTNNTMKSSATPVHWRKSFKNNYETSAS